MIGKTRLASSRLVGVAGLFGALSALSMLSALAACAQEQEPEGTYSSPLLLNRGVRWIGTATACAAPPEWIAQALFTAPVPGADDLCVYTWAPGNPASQPTNAEVAALFAMSGATELTEDVPVLVPMTQALTSPEETAFYQGLRDALRLHVGDQSLLPAWPARPAVRIAVVDTAPDAHDGALAPGLDRHGDTLARLLEDLLCRPSSPGRPSHTCVAEITTALALPWVAPGVLGGNGGHVGTLVDLARAIERVTLQWEHDLAVVRGTPSRLLLNLSVGWEHTAGIADCPEDYSAPVGPPARGVRGILQYAVARGALVFAAAGNDPGGSRPRTGLTCPGRYQEMGQLGAPAQPLLYAVSGVDYGDRPLRSARAAGHTGIVGVGLGGVAWGANDSTPPALIGSSVATAVATAVGALTWAFRPSWSAGQIAQAVYEGGVDAGATAEQCPAVFDECRTRRASVCGALHAAGATSACKPALPWSGSGPSLAAQTAALAATVTVAPSNAGAPLSAPLSGVPYDASPSMQVEPWTFPMPIQATCPTCWVSSQMSVSQRQLVIPAANRTLLSPMLVVELQGSGPGGGPVMAVWLGTDLLPGMSYVFWLPSTWMIRSATLTGFDVGEAHSISEQLFVEN